MLTDTLLPPPADLGLPPKFAQWRPRQDAAVLRAAEAPQRFVVSALPTGCVAANTVVQIARGRVLRASRQRSIAEEFRKQHGGLRQPDVLSYTRALVNHEWIGAHPVQGVSYSGVRETYALRLANGRTLRATPDHEIHTRHGWVPLAALTGTDHVLCDGYAEQPRKPKAQYRRVQGLHHHPFAGGVSSYRSRGGYVEGRLYCVPYHRLVVEASLNGIPVDTLIRVCRVEPVIAATLSFLDPEEYAIHHLDRDTRNNALDNLELLTHEEHQRQHGKEEAFRHFGLRPTTSTVATLERWGDEETYDLVCVDPHHNFVANGIVIHNSGKSAMVLAVSRLVGGRAVVLTSTKALSAQYMDDFRSMGLVEVKGQNAYPCRALQEPDAGHLQEAVAGLRVWPRLHAEETGYTPRNTCDEGPCHVGLPCKLRRAGCHYYDAVRTADGAELVVTNYAFWLTINQFRKRRVGQDDDADQATDEGVIEGIGKFDLLVLDEAHDAPEELSGFLTVKLTQADVEGLLGSRLLPIESAQDQWQQWAAHQLGRCQALLEAAQEAVRSSGGSDRTASRQAKALRSLLRSLTLLGTLGVEWVIEALQEDGRPAAAHPDLQFAPVWPAPLAEQYLFRETPRVLLVSATVRPKTLEYLGIPQSDAAFWEEASTFPVARRPVYHFGTVRLTHRSDEMSLRAWMTLIDQIIRARPGVRGIIHTGSYQRARFIADHTKFRSRMLWHRSAAAWQAQGRTLVQAIEEFRTRPVGEGLWLISPAVTTGYDFPGDQCRVQIIAKVPFPDTRSELIKVRTQRDPDYGMYLAMQTLVQATGRSTRSEDDWSECFIVDSQITWFIHKYRHFAPRWFMEAYRSTPVIPSAPRWEKEEVA